MLLSFSLPPFNGTCFKRWIFNSRYIYYLGDIPHPIPTHTNTHTHLKSMSPWYQRGMQSASPYQANTGKDYLPTTLPLLCFSLCFLITVCPVNFSSFSNSTNQELKASISFVSCRFLPRLVRADFQNKRNSRPLLIISRQAHNPAASIYEVKQWNKQCWL